MFEFFNKNESGNITILFAITLLLLMVFLGLSIDIGLAINKRDKLKEVGYLIRDARFDATEELWNSYNPEGVLREIAKDIAEKNNLQRHQADIEWNETLNRPSRRFAELKTIMTDVYHCTTLRLFGIDELPIKVVIDGSLEKESNRVWRPGW